METGYTCDTLGGQPTDENYIIARVSPAYQSSPVSENSALFIAGIVGILAIMATGYLIIYNIFQISVIQDIQSYGQLKTLGTTRRQIKKIINKQAILLSAVGIPIGLIIGFLIGRALVPALMNGTTYTSEAGVVVTVNPLIFIGSLSLLLLLFISVYENRLRLQAQSHRLRLSATRKMTQVHFKQRNVWLQKNQTGGAKIHRMALANLGRNPKTDSPCNRVHDIEFGAVQYSYSLYPAVLIL